MRPARVVRMLAAATMVVAPFALQGQPKGCAANSIASISPPSVGSQAQAAASSPSLWAVVDGSCWDLSSYFTDVEKGKTWAMNIQNKDVGFGLFSLSALINADPFISFGVTTTNLSAGPTTYAFLFGSPVVPGLYNNATSTGGVSVTNGARGTSTVTTSGIYPTYISGYGTVGITPTNLGVDLGTASCTASGAPFTVTTTCAQGSFSNNFAPTFYDGMQALLTYKQDDLGSVASWSGAVTLNAQQVVPEPATFVLVGAGMLMVGVVTRRRKG